MTRIWATNVFCKRESRRAWALWLCQNDLDMTCDGLDRPGHCWEPIAICRGQHCAWWHAGEPAAHQHRHSLLLTGNMGSADQRVCYNKRERTGCPPEGPALKLPILQTAHAPALSLQIRAQSTSVCMHVTGCTDLDIVRPQLLISQEVDVRVLQAVVGQVKAGRPDRVCHGNAPLPQQLPAGGIDI